MPRDKLSVHHVKGADGPGIRSPPGDTTGVKGWVRGLDHVSVNRSDKSARSRRCEELPPVPLVRWVRLVAAGIPLRGSIWRFGPVDRLRSATSHRTGGGWFSPSKPTRPPTTRA